ncbi:hypothetical protein [Microbacterium sp.]|uniref:hypothetical protein n=1 Tax=Microbacterium sp. TaxID=51671 RepID=UPI0028121C27|nr:hypothetical protein [Microbacterium sp.]
MNTTLPTTMERTPETGRSTAHPPDTGDRQILTIPAQDEQRRLTPAERLSFRIGLWLLHRGIRAVEREERLAPPPERPRIDGREAMALLTFDLQRRLL